MTFLVQYLIVLAVLLAVGFYFVVGCHLADDYLKRSSARGRYLKPRNYWFALVIILVWPIRWVYHKGLETWDRLDEKINDRYRAAHYADRIKETS